MQEVSSSDLDKKKNKRQRVTWKMKETLWAKKCLQVDNTGLSSEQWLGSSAEDNGELGRQGTARQIMEGL